MPMEPDELFADTTQTNHNKTVKKNIERAVVAAVPE